MERSSDTSDRAQHKASLHRRSIDCDLDNSSNTAESSEHESSSPQSSSSSSSLDIIQTSATVSDSNCDHDHDDNDGAQHDERGSDTRLPLDTELQFSLNKPDIHNDDDNDDIEVNNNTSKIASNVRKSYPNRRRKKVYRHNMRQNSSQSLDQGSVKVTDETDDDRDTEQSGNDSDDHGDDSGFRNNEKGRSKSSAHNKFNEHSTSCSTTGKSLLRKSSDDKSTSTSMVQSIVFGSRELDESTSLPPRRRAARQSKLVQIRHDGESDDCECIRKKLKNLHFIDSGDRSPVLSRIDGDEATDHNNNKINSNDSDSNETNHCNADCSREHSDIERVGQIQQSCGHSSQTRKTISKCSESSIGSNVLSGIRTQLKRFFNLERSLLFNQDASCGTKPSVERQRSILKNLKPLSNKGADEESIEWQGQQTESLIGGNRKQAMSNYNYGTGSGSGYQALDSLDDSRRVNGFKSGPRNRGVRRSSGPDGYLRLGNNYHRKTPELSFLQELKRFLLLLLIVAICGVILWQIYLILIEENNYLGTVRYSPSVLGNFKQYAVSTDAEPCAKIGKNLLARGGHAVDAAVGTLICMGVALPNSLGLGGGCLITIYDNTTKNAIVIDGRETAPDYATESMFAANPLSASRGPLSIGIPGELAAYWEAHKRYGRLPWKDLFTETIEMAEKGFPTVEHLSSAFRDMSHAKYITPLLAKVLTNNATGEYYYEGEIMRLPQLAETLKRIRDGGADEFYNGPTGKLFVEDLQKQGGKMTVDNLRGYQAIVRPAYEVKLNGNLKAYTQPIPGSGVVLSVILRIMNELGYYKNLTPRTNFEASGLYYHHLAEAFKFAYARRAALEDMPDDPVRMDKLMASLASDEFIKDAVSKINDSRTLPSSSYGGLDYFQEDHGTAHASVVDSEGNSVAVTSSVNLYFGSGLISPRTGIIYNDVMDDFTSPNITNKFDLRPSKYNRIRPGKRPLSSMAPSIFIDSLGNPRLVIGASGGSKITTAIATVAIRNLFFDEDIKTAVDGPRIHHQFLPDTVWYEANFPTEILSTIVNRGHKLQLITGRSSVVMAVACNYTSHAKEITANSDYRKGGSVDGL